ncbi:aminopeptidase N [Hamadaea tsunoensis]|uniref:aminopeptidase N n=1 Tax=Hamadaea tsunoensis TaxID=53368 RepID=UPI0004830939|nr:aminopeptidase N [Hamadaea tsunoensis]
MRNLTQTEAVERARLLKVGSYDISIDLTDGSGNPGDGTFHSVTRVTFDCSEPGAQTFIEVAARAIRGATLNGAPVDVSGWADTTGLPLTGLAAHNVLVVDADYDYSTSGQGLHRAVDPVDKEVYLYSQFETQDAQKVYACFDQPDLKATYTWHVTAPRHWKVVSNSPVASVEQGEPGAQIVHFAESATMSTYVTALCAGAYHEVRDSHDGIDLGIFCRASMAQYLDPEEIFLITKQGFDFFHAKFGVRYPLPKYDQLIVPEFNAGAMENFGCITNAEQWFIFRSAVTDYEYEQRANTILHEMAHMWFGDLVTMRWWDDLWLNESFAEWASHWANTEGTRFTDAWTTFLSIRKNWGYRQDQMSSTHPVYSEMPDVAAVEVNFDGITYAKGASVIKQLVAYVGIEPFTQGLRSYFAKHAWGNATFTDLLTELEAASGRELTDFADQWLKTAQVNTLTPVVEIGEDGAYASVKVLQSAPDSHPVLRTHRIGVGLFDLDGDRLVRRDVIEVDVTGPETEITALAGVKAADALVLNEGDHSYLKLRLDDRSMATVVRHIGGFASSLTRALCWAAAWDMVRDAELATRDYLTQVVSGLPTEDDVNLVTATLNQLRSALTFYADPQWAPTGWARLASTARETMIAAEPGSGFQLLWARAFIGAARSADELAELRGWLDGKGVPAGLTIAGELRWQLVQALAANGVLSRDEVEDEHAADQTASGDKEAATAVTLLPDPEAKAAAWAELTGDEEPANWRSRALLLGFQHPTQVELTQPYAQKFLDVAAEIWAKRDSEPAQEFLVLGYPALQVSDEMVAATEAWLAQDGHPAPLRRLVGEGVDSVARALKARACDAAA